MQFDSVHFDPAIKETAFYMPHDSLLSVAGDKAQLFNCKDLMHCFKVTLNMV